MRCQEGRGGGLAGKVQAAARAAKAVWHTRQIERSHMEDTGRNPSADARGSVSQQGLSALCPDPRSTTCSCFLFPGAAPQELAYLATAAEEAAYRGACGLEGEGGGRPVGWKAAGSGLEARKERTAGPTNRGVCADVKGEGEVKRVERDCMPPPCLAVWAVLPMECARAAGLDGVPAG
eukprot:483569-Pelagomonas_calceolata.AAC.3